MRLRLSGIGGNITRILEEAERNSVDDETPATALHFPEITEFLYPDYLWLMDEGAAPIT
jgi:hypothetical protein